MSAQLQVWEQWAAMMQRQWELELQNHPLHQSAARHHHRRYTYSAQLHNNRNHHDGAANHPSAFIRPHPPPPVSASSSDRDANQLWGRSDVQSPFDPSHHGLKGHRHAQMQNRGSISSTRALHSQHSDTSSLSGSSPTIERCRRRSFSEIHSFALPSHLRHHSMPQSSRTTASPSSLMDGGENAYVGGDDDGATVPAGIGVGCSSLTFSLSRPRSTSMPTDSEVVPPQFLLAEHSVEVVVAMGDRVDEGHGNAVQSQREQHRVALLRSRTMPSSSSSSSSSYHESDCMNHDQPASLIRQRVSIRERVRSWFHFGSRSSSSARSNDNAQPAAVSSTSSAPPTSSSLSRDAPPHRSLTLASGRQVAVQEMEIPYAYASTNATTVPAAPNRMTRPTSTPTPNTTPVGCTRSSSSVSEYHSRSHSMYVNKNQNHELQNAMHAAALAKTLISRIDKAAVEIREGQGAAGSAAIKESRKDATRTRARSLDVGHTSSDSSNTLSTDSRSDIETPPSPSCPPLPSVCRLNQERPLSGTPNDSLSIVSSSQSGKLDGATSTATHPPASSSSSSDVHRFSRSHHRIRRVNEMLSRRATMPASIGSSASKNGGADNQQHQHLPSRIQTRSSMHPSTQAHEVAANATAAATTIINGSRPVASAPDSNLLDMLALQQHRDEQHQKMRLAEQGGQLMRSQAGFEFVVASTYANSSVASTCNYPSAPPIPAPPPPPSPPPSSFHVGDSSSTVPASSLSEMTVGQELERDPEFLAMVQSRPRRSSKVFTFERPRRHRRATQ